MKIQRIQGHDLKEQVVHLDYVFQSTAVLNSARDQGKQGLIYPARTCRKPKNEGGARSRWEPYNFFFKGAE
eukprot:846577-Pelagomonas_calceolata.AAC.2